MSASYVCSALAYPLLLAFLREPASLRPIDWMHNIAVVIATTATKICEKKLGQHTCVKKRVKVDALLELIYMKRIC